MHCDAHVKHFEEVRVACATKIRINNGSPERIRTAVTALRGRRPRPLDDGAINI